MPLPGGALRVLRPADPSGMVDAIETLDADERLPYWAELWPSGIALAAAVAEGAVPVAGRTVLELGAGVGLVSLAAERAGAARVCATDWEPDALAYAAENARLNGLSLETAPLDWRHPPESPIWEVLLAADVLYEARNAEPVAGALAALLSAGGEAWLADPGRTFTRDCLARLSGWRIEHRRVRALGALVPNGSVGVDLYRLRPPAAAQDSGASR